MIDITGRSFGRWRVVSFSRAKLRNGKHHGEYWNCVCKCGTTKEVDAQSLRSGGTKSCGCLSREHSTKHGIGGTRIYRVWKAIKTRCYNRNAKNYRDYGARGIRMCRRWLASPLNMLADLGPPPSSSHSIERNDNDGPYAPWNCRWASPVEQGNNKRNNVRITHDGQTMTLSQWGRIVGIRPLTIRKRIKELGWPISKALSTPVR